MTRLRATYKNFWTRYKTYQHFWVSDFAVAEADGATISVATSIINGSLLTDASIAGQTISRNVTLIAGTATGNANASGTNLLDEWHLFAGSVTITTPGQIITIGLDLLEPPVRVDGEAPLNTRLNADYRHVDQNRRQIWRRFWAQYEGAGVTVTLPVVLIAASLISDDDGVSGDANAQGETLEVIASLIDGIATCSVDVSGDDVYCSAEIIPGEATGDANAAGSTVSVLVYLAAGTSIPGEILTSTAALLAGDVSSEARPSGDVLPVAASIINGVPSVTSYGVSLQVDVSLIDGETYVPPSAFVIGEILYWSASLEPGIATGNGRLLLVTCSLLEGEATGTSPEPEVPTSIRTGGPVFASRRREAEPINAQAWGAVWHKYPILITGVATGTDGTPIPSPSIAPDPEPAPVVVVSERTDPVVSKPIPVLVKPHPVSANPAPINAHVTGMILEHKDWTRDDNDVLMLVLT
jgi:hypothetical protein